MDWVHTIGQCLFIFAATVYLRMWVEMDDQKRKEFIPKYWKRFGPFLLAGQVLMVADDVLVNGWQEFLFIPFQLLLLWGLGWILWKIKRIFEKKEN